VLSTDEVVHDLYASAEVRDVVVERFGANVAPGGIVDRRALADRMFGSDQDRQWVEALLWPRVSRRMMDWRDEIDRRDPRPAAAVVEVPLLFESGMERAFDATIAVVADETLRTGRAGGRGHAAVAERTARQLTQEEKAAKSTYVVTNNGTAADLERALSAVLDMLKG
jgi:dephospho-CoA kinase